MGAAEPDQLDMHLHMAKSLFNRTWALMDAPTASTDQIEEMVHAAHASRYHWTVLIRHGRGTERNAARGDWLLARVYSLIGEPDTARVYGQRCLTRCETHDLGAFDTAFAHESIARAAAAQGLTDLVSQHLALASALGATLGESDREWLATNLTTITTA